MRVLDGATIYSLLKFPELIAGLEEAFRHDYISPPRQIIDVPGMGADQRLLLAMAALDQKGGGAVKLVTVFPDNPQKRLPTIHAVIVVFSESGVPVAVLDGGAVTKLRTGAASALASKYLSKPNSTRLLVMGTGALAPYMAAAHSAARPITQITVWGRDVDRANIAAGEVRKMVGAHVEVVVTGSAEFAAREADIISCATSSFAPVLAGSWLSPGTFVDLVGSFSPSKRETDDDVVLRSRLFVDTFEGALSEAGDLLDPIARSVIDRARIEGELADLVRGHVRGRVRADEITLFKSVGTAIEDLVAARLVIAAAAVHQAKQ